MNSLPSERAAVLATIDPDVTAASTVVTDWCDVGQFQRIMAVVMTGTLGTNATVDAKLRQATDSSGTGAKDITGKSITQLTQAGTDQSDSQAVINCMAEDLDMDNEFAYVALSVTVAVATSDLGAIVLGFDPRNAPASDNDLASVEEIVA